MRPPRPTPSTGPIDGPPAGAVTAVSRFPLDDGARPSLDSAFAELGPILGRFDGNLGATLDHPSADEATITYRFTSRRLLEAWLDSGERQRFLRAVTPLLAGTATTTVSGELASWSDPSHVPTPKWKGAAVVLLALYPTSLVTTWLRALAFPQVAGPVAVLMTNVVGVLVLTWLLLPVLNHLLRSWLHRRSVVPIPIRTKQLIHERRKT